MNYELVYDAASEGFAGWKFVGIGIVLMFAFGALLFFPKLRKILGPLSNRFFGNGYYWLCFVFAVVWTFGSAIFTHSTYQKVANASGDGKCTIVEGKVEEFIPMPEDGHADESFSVSGVKFAFSDFVFSGGYNNTKSHGGAISSGALVRICYLKGANARSNLIARLEVSR